MASSRRGDMPAERSGLTRAWQRHERQWAGNLYVYPVVSRRSRGLSIGINLNPDKGCNFDCVYCQVDRTIPPAVRKVDLERVALELDAVLASEQDGSLYAVPPASALDKGQRGVRDIAFSGDGEPTAYPRFKEAIEIAASARRRFGLEATRLVVITDAAYLSKPKVREALRLLDENNGEIWAKLDAGTEDYFRLVNRPNVSLDAVQAAITDAALVRPLVIQSLFLRVGGRPPDDAEVDAYCRRLESILAAGGRLKAIQIHTIARRPAEAIATPLADAEVDRIAARVGARVGVPVEAYYGVDGG